MLRAAPFTHCALTYLVHEQTFAKLVVTTNAGQGSHSPSSSSGTRAASLSVFVSQPLDDRTDAHESLLGASLIVPRSTRGDLNFDAHAADAAYASPVSCPSTPQAAPSFAPTFAAAELSPDMSSTTVHAFASSVQLAEQQASSSPALDSSALRTRLCFIETDVPVDVRWEQIRGRFSGAPHTQSASSTPRGLSLFTPRALLPTPRNFASAPCATPAAQSLAPAGMKPGDRVPVPAGACDEGSSKGSQFFALVPRGQLAAQQSKQHAGRDAELGPVATAAEADVRGSTSLELKGNAAAAAQLDNNANKRLLRAQAAQQDAIGAALGALQSSGRSVSLALSDSLFPLCRSESEAAATAVLVNV